METENNIENIRRKAIVEIKKRVEKNVGYLHPCNKDRLNDMKRLMFVSGCEFTGWMQQNGIMKNPTDVRRKDDDISAKSLGFENNSDRHKEYMHTTGRQLPLSDNKDCSSYFGTFTENLMIQTFEDPIKMPYGNPGFDWMCKKGDKIDNKSACLRYDIPFWEGWTFPIKWNNIAEWFVLSAWDNRESLKPLHVWVFHKNDIVRDKKFWRRDSISITNKTSHLKKLENYEYIDRLDKLKEICKR